VIASAGDRRLAQETRRQRLTDQELALGLLEGYHRPAAAMAALERALAWAPERADVVATLVMASGRPEWQLARLEQHGELVARSPSLAAAKADVLERLGRTDEAAALRARLPPPATADDFFVLALRERHKADAGDRSANARGAAAVTRAILLAPTPQCAHFVLRAELVSALGDRAAIEDTTAAIERHWPDSPSALALCALALSEVDQGRGIAVARRAVALDPTHARAQGILGQLLGDAGAVDEGIAYVREAIRLAPDFVQARLSLAVLLYQKGDAAASTAQLRVLLEEEHLGLMIRVIAHRHLAPALLATGDGDGAAATLQRALELAPDDVDLHLDLGKVYTQLGRVDDALATYAAAMTLAPERADLHHDLAYARLASGQVDDAIAGFERALELAPGDALALANLGQAFRRNGDLARAVDALQRAVAIDSNHASAHRWLVEILREVGDTLAARAELQRWADQHPADAAAWNDLAWFLVDPAADADQRDPRAGLAAAERAAELSERREAAYLDTLAWATFHAGDHAAAVAIEEEALAAWRASGAGDSKLGQELEAALVRFRAAMAARR
jgi:tetratricopeptide (TPR) repeat protein